VVKELGNGPPKGQPYRFIDYGSILSVNVMSRLSLNQAASLVY
jgi:hypothetical protein